MALWYFVLDRVIIYWNESPHLDSCAVNNMVTNVLVGESGSRLWAVSWDEPPECCEYGRAGPVWEAVGCVPRATLLRCWSSSLGLAGLVALLGLLTWRTTLRGRRTMRGRGALTLRVLRQGLGPFPGTLLPLPASPLLYPSYPCVWHQQVLLSSGSYRGLSKSQPCSKVRERPGGRLDGEIQVLSLSPFLVRCLNTSPIRDHYPSHSFYCWHGTPRPWELCPPGSLWPGVNHSGGCPILPL